MSARHESNFPLMADRYPADIRDDIGSFAEISRIANQLASNPLITLIDRRSRLIRLERAVAGLPVELWSADVADLVSRHRLGLKRHGLSTERSLRIVAACRADIDAAPRETWADVLAYCSQIAAPIGRHLLILNREDSQACGAFSDALYSATHILDKVCSAASTDEPFQRLCIPLGFLHDACIDIGHLRIHTARGQTRAVLYRVLDGIDRLLDEAEGLVDLIRARPLRVNTATALARARLLSSACRTRDPLQAPVTLTDWQKWRCAWSGWRGSIA